MSTGATIVLLLWLWIDSSSTPEPQPPPLSVITLNTAQGRGTGLHQALLKREEIETHLDAIAAVVRRERPDVVGLQEVDGPSLWSGQFNHVEYLSTTAKLPHSFHGEHMQAFGLSYGTALLARTPLTDSVSVAFSPSPPTPSKGFVVSRVTWPERPDIRVTVVSPHLDFSRSAVRTSQVHAMVDTLSQLEHLLIVLGDLNCEMFGGDDSLRTLCKQLSLAAYRADAADLATFPSSARRLDWILISPELEFATYTVLPDTLSDHRAVVAQLRLKVSVR